MEGGLSYSPEDQPEKVGTEMGTKPGVKKQIRLFLFPPLEPGGTRPEASCPELLLELTDRDRTEARVSKWTSWPGNPSLFSNHLRTVAANLRKLGIDLSFDKNGRSTSNAHYRDVQDRAGGATAATRAPPGGRADSAGGVADGADGVRTGSGGLSSSSDGNSWSFRQKQQLIWPRGAHPSAPFAPSPWRRVRHRPGIRCARRRC